MTRVESRTEYGWSTTYYGLVLDILKRDDEVCDIGQFSRQQRRLLLRAVRAGLLSSHPEAGPFPRGKRCYAAPEFNFEGAREQHIAEMKRLAALDAQIRKFGQPAHRTTGLRS